MSITPDDKREKLHRIIYAAVSRFDATMRAAKEAMRGQEEQWSAVRDRAAKQMARFENVRPTVELGLRRHERACNAAADAARRQEEQLVRLHDLVRTPDWKAFDQALPAFEFPQQLNPIVEEAAALPSIPALLEEIRDAVREARDRGQGQGVGRLVGLPKDVQALALLVTNEDWSIAQIADALGVSRTTPYTWKRFMKSWNATHGDRHDLPRGEKDEEGNLEAEA